MNIAASSDNESLPNVDFEDDSWSVAYPSAPEEVVNNNSVLDEKVIKVGQGYSPAINDSGDPSDEFSTVVLYTDFYSKDIKISKCKNNYV